MRGHTNRLELFGAFVWFEPAYEITHCTREGPDCSFGVGSEQGLAFGECIFDRVDDGQPD